MTDLENSLIQDGEVGHRALPIFKQISVRIKLRVLKRDEK
jgi:hypothetical protein